MDELQEGVAVSHDASDRGMMLVTASRLEIGAEVTIVLTVPPEGGEERRVHGHVVRVEPNLEDPQGMWPHRMAVEFDHKVPEVERVLAALEAKGFAERKR
ncbi:MAG: PilZ domain-containing protein [Polyangiaceae bacterium]|nr:PilZ domain-containing protein [Polyangiaceae bacterium]